MALTLSSNYLQERSAQKKTIDGYWKLWAGILPQQIIRVSILQITLQKTWPHIQVRIFEKPAIKPKNRENSIFPNYFFSISCALCSPTFDLQIFLLQTLMNAGTTLTTDARSSVTTLSEGTTAPVAMVTTWTRTDTLALVQLILLLKIGTPNVTGKGKGT